MSDGDDFSTTQVSAGHLRAIVERIERLAEEKAEVAEQIKEVYAEAKGNGFDTKTIREIIKLRKMKPEERSEREAMLELYMHALGMDGTPLGDWAESQDVKAVQLEPERTPEPEPTAEAAPKKARAKAPKKSPAKRPEKKQDLSPAAAKWAADQAAGRA